MNLKININGKTLQVSANPGETFTNSIEDERVFWYKAWLRRRPMWRLRHI